MQQENQNPPCAERCYNCGIKNPNASHQMWCRDVNKPNPNYHSKGLSQLKEQKLSKQEASIPLSIEKCQNCNIPTFTSFHAFKAENIKYFLQHQQPAQQQGSKMVIIREVPHRPPQLPPQIKPSHRQQQFQNPQDQPYKPEARIFQQQHVYQGNGKKPSQRRIPERTQFKFGVESLIREQNRVGVNDMTPEQLYEFFTEKDSKEKQGYGEKVIRSLRWSILKQDSQEICQVCQEMQLQSEKVFELTSCGHQFHYDCFCQWLTYSKACPICKKQVIL